MSWASHGVVLRLCRMESTLEKLERYRYLLRLVTDERACKALMELISEAEARLRPEERERPWPRADDREPRRRVR
jgi:hypothetical protein